MCCFVYSPVAADDEREDKYLPPDDERIEGLHHNIPYKGEGLYRATISEIEKYLS